jgi:hypothetical protein
MEGDFTSRENPIRDQLVEMGVFEPIVVRGKGTP